MSLKEKWKNSRKSVCLLHLNIREPEDFVFTNPSHFSPLFRKAQIFKQKTAYEIGVRLVGSEMCIRDRSCSTVAPKCDRDCIWCFKISRNLIHYLWVLVIWCYNTFFQVLQHILLVLQPPEMCPPLYKKMLGLSLGWWIGLNIKPMLKCISITESGSNKLNL